MKLPCSHQSQVLLLVLALVLLVIKVGEGVYHNDVKHDTNVFVNTIFVYRNATKIPSPRIYTVAMDKSNLLSLS